jgi:parvulin-like peptidyl-prolyl isomerase
VKNGHGCAATERPGRNGGAAWRVVVAAIVVLTAAGSAPLRGAELLDRVIAVVSGTVITLSDARAAIELGLVDTRGARDPVEAAMQWLVDRRLVLDEALRYDTGGIDALAVDQAVAAIRKRFASDVAYRQALARLGLDDSRIRGLVRDTLAMQQYVARRVDSVLPATDEELRQYFGRHPEQFVRDNRPLAFEEASGEVRTMVEQERRRQALTVWLDRLRRRADVVEIYQPPR